MKDTAAAIRKGYYERLAGISVGVYDTTAPNNDAAKKYVILSTQTATDISPKDRFKNDCTILLDTVVRSSQPTGRLECDNIADEVLQLVYPSRKGGDIEAEGFQIVNTKILQNESVHAMSGTEHVYRRLIRFNHKVVEK